MGAEVRSWYQAADPMPIVGPIYFVGTKGLGVYLIKTDAGSILLFGAMPGSADLIEANVRALVDPKDVKLILTCHAHVDHVGTHASLKKLTGAEVVSMDREAELLESGGKADFQYSGQSFFEFTGVKPDRVVSDGATVTLGGVTLTAHLTPGHTKGTTTWSTTVTGQDGRRYLVVFPDGTSVNSGYRLVKNPSYPGIADDYRKTFAVLESLEPDIALHPHNSFFDFESRRERAKTEGVAAFVDRDAYRRFVAERKKLFEQALAAETGTHD
jgi:metallo-beta-lactamase class B